MPNSLGMREVSAGPSLGGAHGRTASILQTDRLWSTCTQWESPMGEPNGRAQWESPMEPATPHKSTDGVSMQPAGSTGGGGGDTAARSSTQQHAQQQAASAAALAAASVPACLDALGLDDFERRADPRGGVHHHRVELSKDPPQIAFESLTHSLEVAVAD